MTDREALLAAILTHPRDDTPRLMLATDLEEEYPRDAERAEFIRAQCELASKGMRPYHSPDPDCPRRSQKSDRCGSYATGSGGNWRPIGCVDCWAELRRRERELLYPSKGSYVGHRFGDGVHAPWFSIPVEILASQPSFPVHGSPPWITRGFISSTTCSWSDWLAHADALTWWPGATMECPKCGGGKSMVLEVALPGYGPHSEIKRVPAPCKTCGGSVEIEGGKVVVKDGTGRTPRPMPAMAQPIERAKLTECGPVGVNEGGQWRHEPEGWQRNASRIHLHDGGTAYIFDRLKCSKCFGIGASDSYEGMSFSDYDPCPKCNGNALALNEWTCPAWPMQVFEMPEAEPRATHRRTYIYRSFRPSSIETAISSINSRPFGDFAPRSILCTGCNWTREGSHWRVEATFAEDDGIRGGYPETDFNEAFAGAVEVFEARRGNRRMAHVR